MRIRKPKLFGCKIKSFDVARRQPNNRTSGSTGERGFAFWSIPGCDPGTQPALSFVGGAMKSTNRKLRDGAIGRGSEGSRRNGGDVPEEPNSDGREASGGRRRRP